MAQHSYLHIDMVFLFLLLGSCAPPPPKPPNPTIVQATIVATSDVNPDARGRASPVVVRMFELKTLGAFKNADFFSLFDHDKETLGNELLAKEEFMLRPGEKQHFDRQLQADTRFVAVVAAFRSLEKSTWRASMPVRLNQTTPATISLQARDISIIQK